MDNARMISMAVTLLALTGCATLKDTAIRGSVTQAVTNTFDRKVGEKNYHGGHVGRLEVDVPLYRHADFTVGAVLSHESLLDTSHDAGDNRAGLTLEWRPLR